MKEQTTTFWFTSAYEHLCERYVHVVSFYFVHTHVAIPNNWAPQEYAD